MSDAPLTVIGHPTPRVEGVDKVTGAAQYTADVALPGRLWGKVLRSPFAHARIVSIDASEALALPGVVAVITGADIPPLMVGRRVKDQPVLCRDTVRFVGDRVAAVAAVDRDTAERALTLIDVEYEELDAVLDAEEAITPGTPLVHEDPRGYTGSGSAYGDAPNIQGYQSWRVGDVEQGFAESDLIFEQTFRTPRAHQVYLEPHTCTVAIGEDGKVSVWASNKGPFSVRNWLVEASGLPPEDVVVHPVRIGGDFGGKGAHMNIPLCYFLAKASGRPVTMLMTYVEEMTAGNPRHASTITIKTGLKQDGRIWARQARLLFDGGAYAAFKAGPALGGARKAGGPYKIPHCQIESILAYTNSVPCGHYRGPGSAQTLFAVESHTDFLAKQIGMDPLEFRLRNAIREGDTSPNGEHWHDVMLAPVLERTRAVAGWDAPKPPNVGRGMAVAYYSTGLGESGTVIEIGADGSVTVLSGLPDTGTGSHTLLQQIVAEVLQRPVERVQMRAAPTGTVPFDSGSGASRVTHIAGTATLRAAERARETLLDMAAESLGCPSSELELRGGAVTNRQGEVQISWADLTAWATRSSDAPIRVTETYKQDEDSHLETFAAYTAEVHVDPETGQVTVLKMTTVDDTGPILNPLALEGQLQGGLVQGLGYGLMEELRVEDGRVVTVGLNDYKAPSIGDIPPLTAVQITDGHGPGPFGSKAVGEVSIVPVAPALANAVYDAIGVQIPELPVTAEKVFWALRQREGAAGERVG